MSEDLEHKLVLGIDECNNDEGSTRKPLIHVAYLAVPSQIPDSLNLNRNKRGGALKEPLSDKGRRFLERAKGFLRGISSFRYVVTPSNLTDISDFDKRSQALLRLVHTATTELTTEEPQIIIDGDYGHLRNVRNDVERRLASLQNPRKIRLMKEADKHCKTVRVADNIAYCLAALYFQEGEWYKPENRIPFN